MVTGFHPHRFAAAIALFRRPMSKIRSRFTTGGFPLASNSLIQNVVGSTGTNSMIRNPQQAIEYFGDFSSSVHPDFTLADGNLAQMPFTLSHTVVAIPLLRFRRWSDPVALVIGTMVPDAGYFVQGLPRGHASHTLSGSFLTALPVGIMVWVLVALLGIRASSLMPTNFRQLVLPALWAMRKPRNIFLAVPSLWIGIASHNFLDAFTHPSGWFVERSQLLEKSLGTFPLLGELPMFHLLQHLGTILGVLCLFVLAARQIQKIPFTRSDWNKVAVASGILLVSFLMVLPDALALASRFEGMLAIRVLAVETLVTTISRFLLLYLGLALLFSFWKPSDELTYPWK